MPDQSGVLIDVNGCYNGDFHIGKAHGQGKYNNFRD